MLIFHPPGSPVRIDVNNGCGLGFGYGFPRFLSGVLMVRNGKEFPPQEGYTRFIVPLSLVNFNGYNQNYRIDM